MNLASIATRALLAASLLAPTAAAQLCPLPADNFWKNDVLPQVPGGALQFAPVLGLGEGEAAAAVFTLAPGQSSQTVKSVAIGFGSQFVPGGQAELNVEIYDGVSFSGGLPVLGPKVYDLGQDTGGGLQVTSNNIVSLELPGIPPVVGNNPNNNFVVAFRLSINFDSFFSNLMVDATGACAPAGKNLIDIQGQGWRDVTTATVSGLPLCPGFYSGSWVIRACTEGADPVVCQPDLGFQGPGTATLSVCGDALTPAGTADVLLENAPPGSPAFLFFGLFNNPISLVGGQLVPFPWLNVNAFPVTAGGEVLISGIGSGAGPVSLYLQFLVSDPSQTFGFQFSNAVQVNFLP